MNPSSSSTDHLYVQEISEAWQFRQLGTEKWYPAKVPGNIFTDLYDNGLIQDPLMEHNPEKLKWVEEADWEYRTFFVYAQKYVKYDVVDLVFEGLDTYADVFLNEKPVFSSDNMHHVWRKDIKEKIIPDDFELVFKVEEKNELKIVFHSAMKKSLEDYKGQGCILPASEVEPAPRLSVYNRKAAYHFGSEYTPRLLGCGIWRRVYICAWSQARIDNIQYSIRELENKYASLTARFEVEAAKKVHALFRVKSNEDGFSAVMEPASLEPGKNIIELTFEILHPRLWWPKSMGEPSRYEVRGEMTIDTRVAQFVEQKIGLRKIELLDDSLGAGALLEVNGKPLFIKGANWMPLDYFPHRVSKEDYHHVLQHAIEANINMLRIWGGGIYERSDFYELCDEMGILVWHEFMFGTGLYPGSKEMQDRIKTEVQNQLKRLRNYACLALWCGNEGTEVRWKTGEWQKRYEYPPSIRDKVWSDYQKIFYDLIPHLIAKYDTGRLYIPSYPQIEESEKPFVHFTGFPGASRNSSLRTFINESEMELTSPVVAFHQIKKYHSEENESAHHLISKELKEKYPNCPDMPTWVYLSQLLQADKLRTQIEDVRRSRPETMGIFYGNLHDNWLATSDASIDYRGKWKALHYTLRYAYADVLLSTRIEEGSRFSVMIIFDLEEMIHALLEMSLMNFDGKILRRESKKVEILPYSNDYYFDAEVAEWLGGRAKNEHLLEIRLRSGGSLISESLFYFENPKSLKLKKPQLSSTFIHTDNTYRIELISDTLMKNVYLCLKSARGFFSDNYFDILPNRPYRVMLSPVGPELNLGQEMEIRSMVDLF